MAGPSGLDWPPPSDSLMDRVAIRARAYLEATGGEQAHEAESVHSSPPDAHEVPRGDQATFLITMR
eukprot:2005162-Alexandrium_andersonii.AAC.1